MPTMEPEFLGPYKIEETLGEGGMGTVYRATHVKSNEQVAVKIIAESIANQERFRRRFDSEVETLKRLKHKHIVRLIGYGEETGRLFYSMEYVAGETLYHRIAREKQLDWQTTVQLAIETCSALKHAHDFGVIHRDLKPANLLLDKSNAIKVTDFGIAKLYGNSEETALGSVLGTADFMPPEQAEGGRVSARSDLYALGAVMYACLSGRSPHAAKSMPEILYNVRYKEADPLRTRFPTVPKELEILILELLRKDPKQRPPTALVVWNRLSAMQAGLSKLESQRSTEPSDLGDSHINLDDIRASESTKVGSEKTSVIKFPSAAQNVTAKGTELTKASEELMAASHMDNTTDIATHLSKLPVGSTSDVAVPNKTHFTIVDDHSPARRQSRYEATDDQVSWSSYLSIGLLGAAILACFVGIYLSTRRPSADTLYNSVASAVERSSSLADVEVDLLRFQAAYPDDQRLAEFESIQQEITMQHRIETLKRRLQRRGDRSLDPVELAFVEAMDLRDQDPSGAIERLQDFLVVFQDQSLLSPDQRGLVKYARTELSRMTAAIDTLESPMEQYLASQLDAAKLMPVDQRMAICRGIVKLYKDKPIAAAAVARANRMLEADAEAAQ